MPNMLFKDWGAKRVPQPIYDTDHLERLMLQISKRCRKFALKHNRAMGSADNGVWVARGFTRDKYKDRNGLTQSKELAVIGDSPNIAAEKFLTLLDEHEVKL